MVRKEETKKRGTSQMLGQQIPLSWACRQAARAVSNGVCLDEVFDRSLISPKFGDDRDRISSLQMTLFQAVLVQQTNDSTHMMLRHRLEPDTGPLAFRILFGSTNLEDGLNAVSRFYQMASRCLQIKLATDGPYAFLAICADENSDAGCLQEDIQLIYFFLGLSSYLQQPLPVSWLVTRDAQHINLGARHYAIGCPVRLGGTAGFAFPRELLSCRPPRSNVNEFFWHPLHTALRLTELEDPATLSDGASNLDLRVQKLAAEEDIAPSTYRRRMAQTGQNFRAYRERMLLQAAMALLRNQHWCIEAVAAELGYADARSFRRFIKRATGRTPSDIRNEAAAEVSPTLVFKRLGETLEAMRV
jgi:AraC-like DNA-binding protein